MKNAIQSIGLGTAAIGRPQYINIRQEDAIEFSIEAFQKAGKRILEHAYELGVRYFDTAPGYGLAEQLLLDWVMEKEDAEIQVASKWGYTYVADFHPRAEVHEVKEHSLKKLCEQWRQTKSFLPLLTTYQIHSATFETGVLENREVLQKLVELKSEHGLSMGITTTGFNHLEVLKRTLDIEIDGVELFDLFQVTFNVFDQSLAQMMAELHARNKKIVVKEALANGRVFPNEKYNHYRSTYLLLQTLANKYQVGIDAISLRFCLDSLDPFKVLSGAASTSHLTSNLKADEFKLEADDRAALQECMVAPTVYWNERKELSWN